ncbi:MAG TPA: DUF4282 domain-containing protein [Devosiaceae bacterium]|nr:DUF4282 domain-containing protein [Devosiaceae bacterium]
MFWDDLRRLLAGPQLYRLESLITERLVPILFAFGLAAIGLWAIDHLVASFALSFSQGLWGILEIIVLGPLMAMALRIACEFVLVFFKANEMAVQAVTRNRGRDTLLDEVSDAIHDLAEEDIEAEETPPETARPATDPVDPPIKRTVRRPPRRSPPTP